MRRAVVGALILCCATAASFLPQGLASTADAHDTQRQIALDGFFDVAVDEPHGHLYISQGQGTQSVIVTDLSGAPVGSVPGVEDATVMALSPDHSALYVASWTSTPSIVEIDTATLQVLDRFPIPPWTSPARPDQDSYSYPVCPRSLVVMDGIVWFTDGCTQTPGVDLTALDPASGEVTVVDYLGSGAALTANPATHTLYVATHDTIRVYDTATDPAPSAALRLAQRVIGRSGYPRGVRSCIWAGLKDFTFVPGRRLVVTQGGWAYHASDLTHADNYPCGPTFYGEAEGEDHLTIAARADGMVAFGCYGWHSDIRLFAPMTNDLQHDYFFDASPIETRIQPRSLEFGAKRLYAVMVTGTEDEAGAFHPNGAFVHVVTPRRPYYLTLTTARSNYRIGERVEVTVRYHGQPVPPHRVRISMAIDDPYVGPWRRIDLDSRGRGHFAFRMPDVGSDLVLEGRILDQGGDIVTSHRLLLGNRKTS